MKSIVVIPARYESSRLPGKPLVELAGISMIRRTYHRCLQAVPSEDVYVATDNEQIRRHCRDHGLNCVMTSSQCLTGTDRVAEVAASIDADIYINVQGDEPVLDPADITTVERAARAHPGEVINGFSPITDPEHYTSRHIPKVVMREDNRLLYMSRSPIPGNKSGVFQKSWRQICVYSFSKAALAAFSARADKTPLEESEDIEILRFIEMGFDVRMVQLSDSSIAVDTPEDIPRAEQAIRDRGLTDAG